MKELSWEVGDIYYWKWNKEELEKRAEQAKCGTLYWGRSKIGVINHNNYFLDTYWGPVGTASDLFPKEAVINMMDLTYVGNMKDLKRVPESNRAYYLDSDCVDLNHSNHPSGNFYIRKSAEKNLDKMKRVMVRYLDKINENIRQLSSEKEEVSRNIGNLTIDCSIYIPDDVDISD